METARTATVFRIRRQRNWTVLTVFGDLDEVGTRGLERQFALAVVWGAFVAVDLSHATVLGESLSDVLTGMDRLLRAFGGRLMILGQSARPGQSASLGHLPRAGLRSDVSLSS
jgi:hypothetical protein